MPTYPIVHSVPNGIRKPAVHRLDDNAASHDVGNVQTRALAPHIALKHGRKPARHLPLLRQRASALNDSSANTQHYSNNAVKGKMHSQRLPPPLKNSPQILDGSGSDLKPPSFVWVRVGHAHSSAFLSHIGLSRRKCHEHVH
jgi:hypothetical protein